MGSPPGWGVAQVPLRRDRIQDVNPSCSGLQLEAQQAIFSSKSAAQTDLIQKQDLRGLESWPQPAVCEKTRREVNEAPWGPHLLR